MVSRPEGFRIGQSGESLGHLLLLLLGQLPAPQAAAALHEVKVIKEGHILRLIRQRLDDRLVRIVGQ